MEEIADKKAALVRPVVGKIYKRKQEMKKPGRIAGNKKKESRRGESRQKEGKTHFNSKHGKTRKKT